MEELGVRHPYDFVAQDAYPGAVAVILLLIIVALKYTSHGQRVNRMLRSVRRKGK